MAKEDYNVHEKGKTQRKCTLVEIQIRSRKSQKLSLIDLFKFHAKQFENLFVWCDHKASVTISSRFANNYTRRCRKKHVV